MNILATAFTSKCKGCSGITASGFNVKNTTLYNGMRIVAMDTNVVPLHSIIQITTKNETFKAIVLDRGGAIKGHRLDLLMSTTTEANNFGVQNVKVTIIKKGKG